MNTIFASLIAFLLSLGREREMTFVGSTPANAVVRAFLAIALSDSVDFIRWKISFNDGKYELRCNYGIGKPNTSGFINGGKWVNMTGALTNEANFYYLHYGHKTLGLRRLNSDLLHIVDAEKHLLVGTGGWSYTLNHVTPVLNGDVHISSGRVMLKDSMAFQGRTPCAVPGILSAEKPCYKLKWYCILYSDAIKNKSGTYKLSGTAWNHRVKVGEWKLIEGKTGTMIFQLNDENGKMMIDLVALDENVVAFSDAQGRLLVGDEDFSYTLSRKW